MEQRGKDILCAKHPLTTDSSFLRMMPSVGHSKSFRVFVFMIQNFQCALIEKDLGQGENAGEEQMVEALEVV